MFKPLHNILYMSILYVKCVYLFLICCTAKKIRQILTKVWRTHLC